MSEHVSKVSSLLKVGGIAVMPVANEVLRYLARVIGNSLKRTRVGDKDYAEGSGGIL